MLESLCSDACIATLLLPQTLTEFSYDDFQVAQQCHLMLPQVEKPDRDHQVWRELTSLADESLLIGCVVLCVTAALSLCAPVGMFVTEKSFYWAVEMLVLMNNLEHMSSSLPLIQLIWQIHSSFSFSCFSRCLM